MKKAIGMLVMLMGLTANAQSPNEKMEQMVKDNVPTLYTECIDNKLVTSLDDDNYTLHYFVNDNKKQTLTASLVKGEYTYNYYMDMYFNVIEATVKYKDGEFIRVKYFKLGENSVDNGVNKSIQVCSRVDTTSIEFAKAYQFLTNGQITNAKFENGLIKCEKIDYSDTCLQTYVNLENSTLTVTNTLNKDEFVYSLKADNALLHD